MEHIQRDGNDSCPLLGEEESPATTDVRSHQIRDVRRIDNGALSSTKRSLAQRIRSRKNRFVQHVLVACHLIDPSGDLMFKQELSSNKVAIEKLTTIRNSVFAYSESIVSKCEYRLPAGCHLMSMLSVGDASARLVDRYLLLRRQLSTSSRWLTRRTSQRGGGRKQHPRMLARLQCTLFL